MTINLNKAIITPNITRTKEFYNEAEKQNSFIKTSQSDCIEISIPQTEVNVFQSLMKNTDNHEKIISPKFNGCHGVGIYCDNKMFFAHFPPYMHRRMKEAIEAALENFDKNKNAQIVFVAPMTKNGVIEKEFKDYIDIILKEFKHSPNIEYLKYPHRSKGKTYTYTGIIDNGVLKNYLN